MGSSQKVLVTIEGPDHFAFQNACSASSWMLSPEWSMGWFCSDSMWDMDRAHDLTNHFTTAFLLATLKGDKDVTARPRAGSGAVRRHHV